MIRTTDADAINALVNDPAIRPHVGGDVAQPVDLTAHVAHPANLFLLGEHGGFGLMWSAPGTMEVHTFVRPAGHGAWALAAARDMVRMAGEHGAVRLWTRVEPNARHVAAFARRSGMRPAGQLTCDLGAGPVLYDLMEMEVSPCQ